jgi:hypothetical protein
MSRHAKTLTVDGAVTILMLHAEVEALGLPGFSGISIHDDDVDTEIEVMHDALSGEQTTALYDVIVAHSWDDPAALPNAKTTRILEIDARTSALIDQGFVFSSKVFSLTLAAQAKMTGIHAVREHVALTYPIKWNTKDDLDTHELTDAATVESFYLTALGTIRTHLDSGTALHDLVNAASDQPSLDAVSDDR